MLGSEQAESDYVVLACGALGMWSLRRIVGASIILTLLLLLLRHTNSSVPTLFTAPTPNAQQGQAQPTRAYPPPPSPPSSSQEESRSQNVLNDITSKPLRERLEYYFPYDLATRFPGYIWQTWRTSPASAAFEQHLRPLEASWSHKNPGFVHEVITDEAASHLVRYLFSSVPEIWDAYDAMPLPVLKADFFRYLILLARGGVYTDIDTEALKSVSQWLPPAVDRLTVGLVIGIEADPDRDDWAKWYARRIQFCQWTIQAKAGHPVLREIVARITETTLRLQKAGQLRKGTTPASISIMEWTGPGIWTDTIFNYFNDRRYFDYADKTNENITVKNFFNIREGRKAGDVVVLPITSFSPGVGQMGAEDVEHPMAFVRHEFEGSWKPESERRINADP